MDHASNPVPGNRTIATADETRDDDETVHRAPAARARVLVFCRFYLTPDFRANVAPLSDEFEFSFLVDGHCPGTEDTRRRFYAAMKKGERSSLLTPADEDDAVARCRLLRHLPRERALQMLHAMACALDEVMSRIEPSAVLCHMVDDYVTHLVFLLASKRGAAFLGYFYSYFPGFIQITDHSNGRAVNAREPTADEVTAALQTASNRFFRQNYKQNDSYTIRRHLFQLLRYRVKQVVFRFRSILQADPDNLHYSVTPYVAERRRLRDLPRRRDFSLDWRNDLAELVQRRKGPVIYFPLGYFPESAIDYWIDDRRIIDYEQRVLDMLRGLGRSGVVLVKEHLHMMGARNSDLYRAIQQVPNVVSVHPLEYSNDVLDAADAVVLGGGSVGIEATLRGKPVFSFCETAYWFGPARAFRLSLSELADWPVQIEAGIRRFSPLTEEDKRQFIAACLRTTVRQRAPGNRWPHIHAGDLRDVLQRATLRPI